MTKIKLTPEVKTALFMQGQAIAMAMEDEDLPEDVRKRLTARVNATMGDVIDRDYQHVATINLS